MNIAPALSTVDKVRDRIVLETVTLAEPSDPIVRAISCRAIEAEQLSPFDDVGASIGRQISTVGFVLRAR